MPKVITCMEGTGTAIHGYLIWCPACDQAHLLDRRWSFNGDVERPTFVPSLIANASEAKRRCHSYITLGLIRYLDDCGHSMKGVTVPLVDWDKAKTFTDV